MPRTRLLPASAISRSVPASATADGTDSVLAEGDGFPLLKARHAPDGYCRQPFACPTMAVACGEYNVLSGAHLETGSKIKIRLLLVSTTPTWLVGSTKMPCGFLIRVRSYCVCVRVPLAGCCSTPMIRSAFMLEPNGPVKTRTRPAKAPPLGSLSDTNRWLGLAVSKAIPSGTANWFFHVWLLTLVGSKRGVVSVMKSFCPSTKSAA